MELRQLVLIVALINAAGYICMHLDKKYAIEGRKRISEASLLTLAIIGGSIGVLIGMYANRHKTRKPLFTIGVPVIIALQVAAIFLIL